MLPDDDGVCASVMFSFSLCCIVEDSACVALVQFANLCFLALLGAPCSSDDSSTGDGGCLACSSTVSFSRCSISFGAGNNNAGC